MNRIMIDIETLDTARTATILQIGACKFDPDDGITEHFNAFVDIESQSLSTISAATLKWWTSQQVMPIWADAIPIDVALDNLRSWLRAQGINDSGFNYEIWCKGTDFDTQILAHAYEKYLHTPAPWKYNSPRDCRTMFKVFEELKAPTENVSKHDALADAIHQAEHLNYILKTLGQP